MSISKKKARAILEEIYQTANHSTLTSALREGAMPLARTYNKIKELSIENEWIDKDFIDLILPPGADEKMANVGTASKILSKILEDEEETEVIEARKVEQYDANGYEIIDEEDEE
jgi:hypothetical protein